MKSRTTFKTCQLPSTYFSNSYGHATLLGSQTMIFCRSVAVLTMLSSYQFTWQPAKLREIWCLDSPDAATKPTSDMNNETGARGQFFYSVILDLLKMPGENCSLMVIFLGTKSKITLNKSKYSHKTHETYIFP